MVTAKERLIYIILDSTSGDVIGHVMVSEAGAALSTAGTSKTL